MYSPEVTRIYSSWNVTIRNVFNLPWTTHRYFVEPVSSTRHPKTMLCSRLVKFWESLRVPECNKDSVRYLFSLVYTDRRTLTVRSASKIAVDCQVERENLDYKHAKKIEYSVPPPVQTWTWRIPLLKELLEIRKDSIHVPGFSCEEIKEIIDDICVN